MNLQDKSKEQLIHELNELQQKYNSLEEFSDSCAFERNLLKSTIKEKVIFSEMLVDITPGMLYIYDIVENKNIYSNDGIQRILGYSIDEVQTMGSQLIPSLMHPEDLKNYISKVIPFYSQAKDGEPIVNQCRMKHKKGYWCWIEFIEIIYKRQENGTVQQIFGLGIDITERKKTNEAFEKQNAYIKMILDNFPIGIATNEIDSMKVTYMNRKFSEIYGWPEEEFPDVSLFFEKVFPDAEYRQQIQNRILEDLSSGDIDRMNWDDLIITTKAGEKRMVCAFNIPLPDQNIMVSTVQNITERKQAEFLLKEKNEEIEAQNEEYLQINQELQQINNELIIAKEKAEENEEKYKQLIGNLHIGIIVHAPDTSIILSNPQASKILGLTQEQLEGKNVMDPNWYFVDETGRRLMPDEYPIAIVISTQKSIINKTYGLNRPQTNDRIWVDVNAYPEFNRNNELTQVVVSFIDITERKLAEFELAESTERFKALHNASFGGIIIHDKGIILECNQGVSEISGYALDELIGMDGLLLIAPDYRDMVMSNIVAGFEKPYEVIGLRKNGETYPVRLEARNVPYKGRKVRTVEFRDITDSKQAEEALRKSEAIKNTMVSNIGDVIVIIDQNGKNQYKSPNISKLFGWDPEELIGKNTWDNVHPSDLTAIQDFFGTITSEPNATGTTELRYKRKDGKYVWIEINIKNLLHDKDIKGLLGNYHDISERKKAELELIAAKEKAEESERKYKSLFTNMMNAFGLHEMMFNENGEPIDYKFLEVNPVWEKIVGIKAETVIGKRIREIMPSIEQSWLDRYGRITLTGIPEEFIDYNAATQKYYNVFAYKLEGKKFAVVFNDVTDKKQFESELIKAKEKAEESDRLKTAFLQNMSHEIRTPMNAIMGFSDLLVQNFNNKSKLKKFSDIISQRCNDLLDIVSDILDISKIESGQLAVNVEECNLSNLFEELAAFFNEYQIRINKQHLKFNLCTEPTENVILIDKGKLKQIFINLINNAFKFTDEGKIEGGCRFDENNKLLFYVSDTGIGIPADKHDVVFERFSQVHQSSKMNMGGTGLGLAITKGLVNLLGGEIFLDSEPGKGSTFSFTFPYETPQPFHHQPLTVENRESINFSNKTVLIVEDDLYNAEYLKEILSNTGLIILHAENGNKAIEISLSQPIDLVLMDIRLPDINGYETTQQIKKHKPNLNIIAQTAYAAHNEKQKALNAGCIDYISKPTKRDQLLTMLSKYLK